MIYISLFTILGLYLDFSQVTLKEVSLTKT